MTKTKRERVMRRILEENARYRDDLKLHPKLAYLFFELTTRCNLECLHCGSSCSKQGVEQNAAAPESAEPSSSNRTDMPASYIDAILDSIEKNCPDDQSYPLLCATGGEPLLYPRLFEVMSAATKRGFNWGMTTNATLINDETARRLYDAGLATVTVSVDGLESSHDWFRKSVGAYKRMEEGLNALVSQAPDTARVDAITVVNKRNLSELPEIYRRLVGCGIRSWRITNMEPIGRALENTDIMLDGNDFIRMLDFVRSTHLSSSSIEVSFGCSHYLGLEYERIARPYCFTCIAGLQVASITPNGDVIACLDIERRPELVQGNIQRDDFWSVWQSGFELFRGDRAAKSHACSGCSDRKYCAGDSAHTWDYDRNEPMICVKQMLEAK